MPRKTRIREIVQLGIVNDIPDATVEGLAQRSMAPAVIARFKAFSRHTANLQRCVDIQIFVEGRNRPFDLAVAVVQLSGSAVFEFEDGGRFAKVDDHADGLSVPEDVNAMPVSVVEAVLRLYPKLERPGAEVDQEPRISTDQLKRDEIRNYLAVVLRWDDGSAVQQDSVRFLAEKFDAQMAFVA